MSNGSGKSIATKFLDEHPELRSAMSASKKFAELKERSAMDIDGERLYAVRGDTLGEEDDFYLDSLIKGSSQQGDGSVYSMSRELFLELDDRLKSLIMERLNKR
ncbi:MAG: hypothetical protein WBP93_21985 [Pyrinomonadaceae bacterium]